MKICFVMTIFTTSVLTRRVACYRRGVPLTTHQAYEFDFDFSPAWRYAAAHMHFLPEMEALADAYVRRAIGNLDAMEPTPPVSFLSLVYAHTILITCTVYRNSRATLRFCQLVR